MSQQKLVIFSGGDRVGKSTLISNIQKFLGEENCDVFHHGAPPYHTSNVFDFYRINRDKWLEGGKKWCLFDRSWACSYCLEDWRRHTHGQLDEIASVEIEFLRMADQFSVIHVAVEKPWQWSAPKHIEELDQMHGDAPAWVIRDEYVARQKEHKHYYERLYDFYENVTAFPSMVHSQSFAKTASEAEARYVVENVKSTLHFFG
jgi:hypothetical protein